MDMPTHFSTDRLVLEPLALTDTDFIAALVNAPGWLAFIGDRSVHTRDDAGAYIRKILATATVRYWVVRLLADSTPVGAVTVIERDYLDHPDIGFALLPEYEGRGYAYEAAAAVLQHLLQCAALPEVLAATMAANVRSIRLLEKLGLTYRYETQQDDAELAVYGIVNPYPALEALGDGDSGR